ncbi:MAG: 3-hydroxyacyl-CoA dehydrogenase family protein [Bacteroidota bacterium]
MQNSINKIGIIGSGKMGTDLFYYLLPFPFELTWVCHISIDPNDLRRSLIKKFSRMLKYNLITAMDLDHKYKTTLISTDLNSLADCDLIIEAIWENESDKINLFEKLNQINNPHALIASNSSSILPSILSAHYSHPQNCVGLHFFYPIGMKSRVEIIRSEKTNDNTLAEIVNFCRQIQRKPILQDETNAFFLNKIALELQNEAFFVQQEHHLNYAVLDKLVSEIFNIGIFDFFDSVGIDVMHASIQQYARQSKTEKYAPLLSLLQQYIEQGNLGQKTGEGFYQYPISDQHHDEMPDEELKEKIRKRLMNAYLNAARYYSDNNMIEQNELNEALKEYFGMENGPFDLIADLTNNCK